MTFTKYFLIAVFLLFSQNLKAQVLEIPQDTVITTYHKGTFNGRPLQYTAETGMQPFWNEKGEVKATLHYTYYHLSEDKKAKQNLAERPLLISFNGGPGSASVWMHIAYTGPVLLNIDAEGHPVQPYGIRENPYSVLDVADILYVNPVNTGYSRTVTKKDEKVNRQDFFGINADIQYLGSWLNTFIGRHNRWLSPKYLIGESYGGTRVSGLAYELQAKHWVYLNGVILVSPADYKSYAADSPVSDALNLPYFTATAWYHQQLSPDFQSKQLSEILPEVEDFTVNQLMPALSRGGFLSEQEKEDLSSKIATYTSLDKRDILQQNLAVSTRFFWKTLLKNEKGMTIGRLDSRYFGIDRKDMGTSPEYNPEITSWLHAFTPAINYYMREKLNFKTDIKYNVFGPVHPWNKENNHTRDNLRKAMAANPYLKVLFQTGYYDGATTYFNSKYTMWQIDPSGKLKDRFEFHTYPSGHMMYLRLEDLKAATNHLREFIVGSMENAQHSPAKYD
ncbi:S10 family peptidase [Persicobacter diffluens]|uniref:Carboxypeptidase n=1 Tax=Persicobacter diffluens TaxID=981 RepID=A0AAN5AMN5_9BACT|nr:carboxypeptidase [Persicobacter diffluens]